MTTGGHGGRTLTKNARAYTNDPKHPVIVFTITCPVDVFAKITPKLVRFNGPVGSDLKEEVRITTTERNPFKIIDSSARDGKNIHFSVKPISESGSPGYVVDVENLKKDVGAYNDIIYLNTDSKVRPKLEIRVYGRLYGPLPEKTVSKKNSEQIPYNADQLEMKPSRVQVKNGKH